MRLKKPNLLRVGLVLLSFLLLETTKAALTEDPPLTQTLIQQLQSLPYGMGKQQSLVLRYRHVAAIQFYGSASNSRFTFRRGHALVPEGLSLKLKNNGDFSWASGIIRFKKPMNVTRYNSIVLWIRTNHPGLRFWIGVQDPQWKQPEESQGRTDVLPFRGFPSNNIIQLVIPYSAIFSSDIPINYSALNQISFEFGEDTVGNIKEGTIDVLGVAFVKQSKPLKRIKLVMHKMPLPPAKPIVQAPSGINQTPLPTSASDNPYVADILTPEPLKGVKPTERSQRTVSKLVDLSDEESSNLFKQFGFEMKKPDSENNEEKKKGWFFRDWIQPYTRSWPLTHSADPSDSRNKKQPFYRNIISPSILVVALLILVGVLFYKRRKRFPFINHLGKVFHEVRWLFSPTDTPTSDRYEKDFWNGLASKNIRFAWISATGLAGAKSANDSFYGEEFLKRQMKHALESGVHLMPSLSFVRTAFNYETFLSSPTLFYLRPVDTEDSQLNDDELRIKVKDCFPVWIPPFWQKKYRLPHRVLVEYGRSIGFARSRDNVELNRTSPALRKMAIQTIEKFVQLAPGVRIENASWLLNSKISGAHHPGKRGAAPISGKEFWTEVISAIKAKNPNFLFIADGAGNDVKALRDVGFDFFEDDYLMETIARQIRLGQVGNISRMLEGDWSRAMNLAIFNITRLLRPAPTTDLKRRQNVLGAVILALLPGIIQHDDTLPDELDKFVKWTTHSSVFRKGKFLVLPSGSSSILTFARWKRKSLYIAAANFSPEQQETTLKLDSVMEGFDDNKLYLFNNALHGVSPLKNIFDQSSSGNGPAMALWGQNLRDFGLPIKIPGLSIKLFSVNLTRPLTAIVSKEIPLNVKIAR